MRGILILVGAAAKRRHRFYLRALAPLLVVLLCSGGSSAYSVLTHEEIVDLLWADEIRPLLLTRYPGLTDDQIKQAHAYAYGGAVIQDLGYYPFAVENSATCCITFAVETSFASCWQKARTSTSTPSRWERYPTTRRMLQVTQR